MVFVSTLLAWFLFQLTHSKRSLVEVILVVILILIRVGPVDAQAPLENISGKKHLPELTPATLLDAAIKGGDYLLRHQMPGGKFPYLYDAREDRYSDQYNLVRHAGTTYSLVLLYETTRDSRYLQAARRGLDLLLANTRKQTPSDASTEFECVVTHGGAVGNLGGTALSVLALLEYATASGDLSIQDRAGRLGKFLLHQQEADGHFICRYIYDGTEESDFESLYYPGESVLALVRLYQSDQNPAWLAASEKGALWLIKVRDADLPIPQLPHDHWLLMALNELYAITRKVEYYNQGIRIAAAIRLDQRKNPQPTEWVGSFGIPPRSAPAATRCEGLVAAYYLSVEGGSPEIEIIEALSLGVDFILQCQVTQEQAVTLPHPERASGGFRESLEGWKIRMDFVQHAICALLGLREIMME